jgi:hypothetical protein
VAFTLCSRSRTGLPCKPNTGNFRHFRKLARPLQYLFHPADRPTGTTQRTKKMTAIRSFASQAIAATTALALSLVLISGTVSTPSATSSATPVQEILA